MRLSRPFTITLISTVVVAAAVAPAGTTGRTTSQACNLRGSWVAGTAEANRYLRSINPTATDINLVRGALSATFNRGTFTFGGLSLTLTAKLGATRIKEVVDIDSVSSYRIRGNAIVLGRGTYKLTYISATLYPRSGGSVPLRLPNQAMNTPGATTTYSCSPSTLRLRLPIPRPPGTVLTLQRDRG